MFFFLYSTLVLRPGNSFFSNNYIQIVDNTNGTITIRSIRVYSVNFTGAA